MYSQISTVQSENNADTRTELEPLVEQASRGDKKALCKLVESISKGVLFQSTYILGDQAGAEDISQEVLIRVCENIQGLRNPKAFKSWLARIIVNEKNRFLSKRLKYGTPLNVDDHLDNIPDEEFLPHERVENTELHKVVMDVISKLPMRQREVIMLHYYSDLSVTEVARSMNITTQTVSKNLAIAREKLKRKFGDQLFESRAQELN